MKQAVMTAPGSIEIRDVPPPIPLPGQALLRIQRIGICGSDVHVYHGKHPFTGYPVIQGHEFSAVVEAVGEGVSGLQPGMKVTSTPQLVCGQCRPCRRGDYHICDRLKVQGFQAPGCAQELWATSADSIVGLPTNFTFEQGAMVEPLSVAVHAASRAGPVAGRRVAVLGAGPIGNLVAQVARAEGSDVLISDLSEYRLQVARACGIVATSNAREETLEEASKRCFGDIGFDLAFECVGVEATVTAAIRAIQKGGTLVIVGVFGEKPRLDIGSVQDRELNICGTLMYRRGDYLRAIDLISSGTVTVAPLMSRHFRLDDFADAYRFIETEGEKAMKVFIDMVSDGELPSKPGAH